MQHGSYDVGSKGSSTEIAPLPPEGCQRDPTAEAHLYWSRAFDFWNAALFEGTLPKVMITLAQARRYKGFFRPRAMENLSGTIVHQIGMNPQFFHRGDAAAHSTLVHEMVHLWREVLGPPNAKGGTGSRGYHDIVWAEKMEDLGLQPSHTGRPGGRRTGHRMTHYILPDGRFDRVFRDMAGDASRIEWRDRMALGLEAPADRIESELSVLGLGRTRGSEPTPLPTPAKKTKDRVKFCCDCGLNAWAKPSARLLCGFCGTPMTAERASR